MAANTIDIDDVAAIVRVLADIPPSADIAIRRRHVMEGLATLIGARVWAWGVSRIDPQRLEPVYFAMIDGGWNSDNQRIIASQPNLDPEVTDGIEKKLLEDTSAHVTRSRTQLISDEQWYQSTFFDRHRRAADLDDFLFSIYPVGDGTISRMGFHRPLGAPPFADRERRIVHVVASQIDWLHREGTNVPAADQVLSLSPRLRQVVLLLLGGLSRKQIARRLNLSEHTVTGHMKQLHRRFDVSSRGELLSKFISGATPSTPPTPHVRGD